MVIHLENNCMEVLTIIYNTFCLTVSSESMAGPRISQSSGHSRWKQWWRSTNTCCSKKILLLLVWQVLFTMSWIFLTFFTSDNVLYASTFLSYSFAPLLGWLADVRFGRYEIFRFGSIVSFLASIFCTVYWRRRCFYSEYCLVVSSNICIKLWFHLLLSSHILPFLSDQMIGATSDELSAVVRWYFWAKQLGFGLAYFIAYLFNFEHFYFSSTFIIAIPLAVIIISDCLCQQWLDRTHKVTNPIKLIIQVLNYTTQL